MKSMDGHEEHDALVAQLTSGFAAMLEQVQELARRNTELEQRIARFQKEYRDTVKSHPNTSTPDLSPEDEQVPAQGQRHRRYGSDLHEEHASSIGIPTGEENAQAIANGVHAWKALTNGEGPLWRRWKRNRQEEDETEIRAEEAQGQMPEDHPLVTPETFHKSGCPFHVMAGFEDQQNAETMGQSAQRPNSLPTPPSAQEHFLEKVSTHASHHTNSSPPPSMSGSVSKCPIRMLDERSPEEVAEYFETHKYEIPRSHEICIKRYQSNAKSIRQLDAKYGNLANMLQGLGMKHQPLLPAKEDEEGFAEADAKAAQKVEKWAGSVREPSNEEMSPSSAADTEERQRHFDRPLKEIRVGESPSRPWGISVPVTGTFEDPSESEALPTPRVATSMNVNEPPSQPPLNARSKVANEGQPQMVFTGPVFIGYSAEQAAALIQKCGWEAQGPTAGS